jgi:hypothetical protein
VRGRSRTCPDRAGNRRRHRQGAQSRQAVPGDAPAHRVRRRPRAGSRLAGLVLERIYRIVGTETIEDAARQPRKCWHLDLKASNDLATYNRVEYWVEQGTFYPIKGKFYADSGRLLKIAYFRKFAEQLGAVRPTESIIIDAVDSSLATTATFGEYAYQEIPEAWFQRDYLPHLRAQ